MRKCQNCHCDCHCNGDLHADDYGVCTCDDDNCQCEKGQDKAEDKTYE